MPNKPKEGLVSVNVKLDADLLARVDAECQRCEGAPCARTDVIRDLIAEHLPEPAKPPRKRATPSAS